MIKLLACTFKLLFKARWKRESPNSNKNYYYNSQQESVSIDFSFPIIFYESNLPIVGDSRHLYFPLSKKNYLYWKTLIQRSPTVYSGHLLSPFKIYVLNYLKVHLATVATLLFPSTGMYSQSSLLKPLFPIFSSLRSHRPHKSSTWKRNRGLLSSSIPYAFNSNTEKPVKSFEHYFRFTRQSVHFKFSSWF